MDLIDYWDSKFLFDYPNAEMNTAEIIANKRHIKEMFRTGIDFINSKGGSFYMLATVPHTVSDLYDPKDLYDIDPEAKYLMYRGSKILEEHPRLYEVFTMVDFE